MTRWKGIAAGACLAGVAARYEAVVDRIEGDRVVVEWCDRTTSDLPAMLFAADLREGAVVALLTAQPPTPFAQQAEPSQNLPEPGTIGTGPRGAARPDDVALTPRGSPRTETQP